MGIGEHFEGVKQHWAGNFAFLDYFKKVYGRAEPLPKWSDADVEEFIATDPVYGPQVGAPIRFPRFPPLPPPLPPASRPTDRCDAMRFLQLKALRESRKFALGGALVGAAHLGGVAIKYSKAPHGTIGD
jgi:hypothetical protein